jgi:dihydrofolate reductase
MKVILVFVTALDGKVTRWDDPDVRRWTSQEDKEHFSRIWNESRLIVMGRGTFAEYPPKPVSGQLFHIMTNNPSAYRDSEVPGRIEFSDEKPRVLVSRFENEGFTEMFVLGGPRIFSSFLKEQLADELWLTIEPRLFGAGMSLAGDEKLDVSLHLISCDRVNEQGTLIARYSILKTQGSGFRSQDKKFPL